MTRPVPPDLFARKSPQTPTRATVPDRISPERKSPPDPFEFTGEGCEPGPEPDDELSRWFNDPRHRWNKGDFG